MALKTNVNVEVYGDTTNYECYTTISNVSGNKHSLHIVVEHKKYTDKSILIKREDFSFEPSVDDMASNFIKQGYEHLKTLPIFLDAIDILEEGQTA